MNKSTLRTIIDDLKDMRTPKLTAEVFSCFSEEALQGNEHVSPAYLDTIAQSLTQDDIPTFERACQAIDDNDLAWLGFKIVFDPEKAVANTDNLVTKAYGEVGSADGQPLVFFCNDAKEIVSSRPPTPRDVFQMKDVTRGPSMHNEQFDGLTWLSVPLFENVKVWLLGASDVASELARQAHHVGFDVIVVDYDNAYASQERFPNAERVILSGDNFDGLEAFEAAPEDYVCILTRGHMFDPEGCAWVARCHPFYAGLMGCAGKNDRVHELVQELGVSEEDWKAIKRPIGLRFGAKSPAELAIAIVAELIDVRYKQRYSKEARKRHEQNLGY